MAPRHRDRSAFRTAGSAAKKTIRWAMQQGSPNAVRGSRTWLSRSSRPRTAGVISDQREYTGSHRRGPARDVRRQEEVGRFPQRVVGRQRLGSVIERRAQASVLELASSASVSTTGPRARLTAAPVAHRGEELRVDQVTGGVGQRREDDDHVGRRQQLGELRGGVHPSRACPATRRSRPRSRRAGVRERDRCSRATIITVLSARESPTVRQPVLLVLCPNEGGDAAQGRDDAPTPSSAVAASWTPRAWQRVTPSGSAPRFPSGGRLRRMTRSRGHPRRDSPTENDRSYGSTTSRLSQDVRPGGG